MILFHPFPEIVEGTQPILGPGKPLLGRFSPPENRLIYILLYLQTALVVVAEGVLGRGKSVDRRHIEKLMGQLLILLPAQPQAEEGTEVKLRAGIALVRLRHPEVVRLIPRLPLEGDIALLYRVGPRLKGNHHQQQKGGNDACM